MNATINLGRNVLVALDLDRDLAHEAAHGARLCELSGGATMHLVHVLEPPPAVLRRILDKGALALHRRQEQARVQERLERLRDQLGSSQKVRIHLLEGDPSEKLLKLAKKIRAGAIVAAVNLEQEHGLPILGSTCDHLLRHSKIPVLCVAPASPVCFKKILVPTDLDRDDAGALRLAAKLAAANEGQVTVLHAFSMPSLLHRYSGDVAELRARAEEQAGQAFDGWLGAVALPSAAKAPARVMKSESDAVHPARAIVAAAQELGTELIVMAMGRRKMMRQLFIGSTAVKLLQMLPCPILALPAAWARRY